MAKKNYVIDTSVFLSDADCIYKFGTADIFISLKVLEEIDKHKKRQDSVGFNARRIIKSLDEIRKRGCLSKGVRIRKGKGILRVVKAGSSFPSELDKTVADHIILSSDKGIENHNILIEYDSFNFLSLQKKRYAKSSTYFRVAMFYSYFI